eukprot:CAMPEP_0174992702 /NCGR_PEP_ID=MMETSP0004_2-20121128/22672_1 /TAXON_ID=420556 /ORGANISM="Ochromonas sp., Strain CCMP1393" /LENGTH=100 /DNA_ID=CAMNT_0016246747 /DNA_START=84 /DNA_END=382 /DNA_ORIENTATION=-
MDYLLETERKLGASGRWVKATSANTTTNTTTGAAKNKNSKNGKKKNQFGDGGGDQEEEEGGGGFYRDPYYTQYHATYCAVVGLLSEPHFAQDKASFFDPP